VKFNNSKITKSLYRLHIYGGLICSVYLFIVGVSVLNFQHQFLPEKETDTISYTRTIQFDPSLKADTLARFIRTKLEIKGNVPPWEYKENKNGMFRFKILRPARTYDVRMNRNSDLIEVKEIHYSLGRIFRAMHFGSIRNKLGDPMLDIWSFYTQTAAIFALITLLLSIYFWFKNSVRNTGQWILIVFSSLFSFVYICIYGW